MNISISGTGYVGMIQGTGLAKLGHSVICVDVDEKKVDNINNKKPPIYERGLQSLMRKVVPKRLTATTDLRAAVLDSQITFICVGTPSQVHGEIKLHQMERICKDIGTVLRKKKAPQVVVVKSTVVPGTCEKIVVPLLEKYSRKKLGKDLGIAMNPEFLREGSALEDFFNPDRIVIGSTDPRSIKAVRRLYSKFKCPILETSFGEAEMIKYSSNALLATKISFINEVGNVCKRLGIDTNKVAEGVGMDYRISPHMLRAGIGFGGSCFPKDVAALVHKGTETGYHTRLLRSVLDVNRDQPLKFLELVERELKGFQGAKLAVLGLTFKAGTDDVRESPSLSIIQELIMRRAKLYLFDPMGMPSVQELFPQLNYMETAQAAVDKAEAVLILTEWPEFKRVNYKNKLVIDGKNLFANNLRPKNYQGICW
jgi:UDPglucose 6-dehydrogenase